MKYGEFFMSVANTFAEDLDDLVLTLCEKYGFDYMNFNMHTPKEGLRDITRHKQKGEVDNMFYSVVEYKDRIVGTVTTNDFINKGVDEDVWGMGGVFRGNKPENRFMKLMRENKLIRVGCALKRIKLC